MNMINRFELVNHRLHDLALMRSKIDSLGPNRECGPCIDIAFIIKDRDTHAFWAEDTPLAFDKGDDLILTIGTEVGNT